MCSDLLIQFYVRGCISVFFLFFHESFRKAVIDRQKKKRHSIQTKKKKINKPSIYRQKCQVSLGDLFVGSVPTPTELGLYSKKILSGPFFLISEN